MNAALPVLKGGDIVFQTSVSGQSTAIAAATRSRGRAAPIDHA